MIELSPGARQGNVTRLIKIIQFVKVRIRYMCTRTNDGMENVEERAISFDDMVDALADVQRRKLMTALLEHNPQNDSPVVITDSEKDADELGRLVSMNHVHLPKLVDYGFITWNEDTHEVEKGPDFDEIRPLIELLDDHKDELPEDWL